MRLYRRVATLVFAAAVILFPGSGPAGEKERENDAWAPFRFLIGAWSGVGSGKPGEAIAGSTEFALELDKNILVRRNRAEYGPKQGETRGNVHEDLLIIYRQPGGQDFRAIYFDNEGHTINYAVTPPQKQSSVTFDTDPAQKGPRFRLVYDLSKDGTLTTEFLVAPPGGDLKTYVKGTLRRK